MDWRAVLGVISIAVYPQIARAAETQTNSYDARGRLKKVERSGSVNSGVKTEYTHDKANNRTTVVVTGST